MIKLHMPPWTTLFDVYILICISSLFFYLISSKTALHNTCNIHVVLFRDILRPKYVNKIFVRVISRSVVSGGAISYRTSMGRVSENVKEYDDSATWHDDT